MGEKRHPLLFDLDLVPDHELRPEASDTARECGETEIARVNELQCLAVAPRLLQLRERMTSQDAFALKDEEPDVQIRALLYLVAICHAVNWDYLMSSVARSLCDRTAGFVPDRVVRLSEAELRTAFHGYRRKDERLHLRRRLEMLHAIGVAEAERGVLAAHALTGDRVDGDTGLAHAIDSLPVYEDDPLKKKRNALLHELARRRLLTIVDEENLQPAVDYHLLRTHLRTWRVMVFDPDLRSRLVSRRPVRIEQITKLRRVTADAVRCTARVLGLTVPEVNELEWRFGRTHCRREFVACAAGGDGCALAPVCVSAGQPVESMLAEPRSAHGHY